MNALTPENLNPAIRNVEYAVRGELAIKAEHFRDALKGDGASDLPFDKVTSTNIGNPQQKGLDQPPITFNRQVAALTEWPALADVAPHAFPADVIARAKELLGEIGSIGAYSHSQGVPIIRKSVAKFIEDRDGHPADPAHIFLTAGASAGVSLLIEMMMTENAGILLPLPQYPLYSATLAQHDGKAVPYYLDEAQGWSTPVASIRAALEQAATDGVKPKALVVINPGNPTGALLDYDTMAELVRVCEEHGLALLADEVYQSNLHQPDHFPFTSFKKVVRDLRSPVALFSFHSISKGVTGECGRRGGYFECTNIREDVLAMIYKMVSVGLCPPLGGQIGVDCMVRPPREGEPSYPLWKEETDRTHAVLRERTRAMAKRLNALDGVSCVDSPGALYLFPKIALPEAAVSAAEKAGKPADGFYAMQLLEATGICVIPGSGFGQKPGEYHYRLTCLVPGVDEYVGKLEKFHREFVQKYA